MKNNKELEDKKLKKQELVMEDENENLDATLELTDQNFKKTEPVIDETNNGIDLLAQIKDDYIESLEDPLMKEIREEVEVAIPTIDEQAIELEMPAQIPSLEELPKAEEIPEVKIDEPKAEKGKPKVKKEQPKVEKKIKTKTQAQKPISQEKQLKFLKSITALSTTITIVVLAAVVILYINTMSSMDTSSLLVIGEYSLKVEQNLQLQNSGLNFVEFRDPNNNATYSLTIYETGDSSNWTINSSIYDCTVVNDNGLVIDVAVTFEDSNKNISDVQYIIDGLTSSVSRQTGSEVVFPMTAREFKGYQVFIASNIDTTVENGVLILKPSTDEQISIKILETGYQSSLDALETSIDSLVESGNNSVLESGIRNINDSEWFVLNQLLGNNTAKYLCLQSFDEDSAKVVEIIYNTNNLDSEEYLTTMSEILNTLELISE